MGIDRDEREERQARLDWMISEFQKARVRRLPKATEQSVDHTHSNTKAPLTEQSPPTHARRPAGPPSQERVC